MKSSKWLGGLAAVLLIGSTAVLRAEDMGKGDDPGMEMQGMKDMGKGKPMDRMKEKLGLTDPQASKLKELFKQQREEMKPLRDQMKIDIDTLQQKVDTKASDSTIKKLLDDLSSDRDKMQTGRKKMETELREILSPTQQAKMVLGMKDKGRQKMGKWKGKMMGKGSKGGPEKGHDPKPTSDGEKDAGDGN